MMVDFQLAFPDDEATAPDLQMAGGDLVFSDGLLEAFWLSLCTDRRAPNTLKIEGKDRRGYWADAIATRPIGSLLWTLSREKQTEETRLRGKQIAEEALFWMPPSNESAVRDVVSVTVATWWAGRGVLAIDPTATLTSGAVRPFAFKYGLETGQARYFGTI